MIRTINGDLLLAEDDYIAHQCNCVSKGSAGLAYYIFQKYPYANIYEQRTEPSTPGTIHIAKGERNIINMFGQYYPGGLNYPDSKKDGIKARESYFYSCLQEIAKIPDLKTLGLPYLIGCGIAQGNWDNYYKMIVDFADNNKNIGVTIYEHDAV